VREKGTGSITQRSTDGMYVVRVELPSDGLKRRRKTVVRKKKADAIAALRQMRKDLERAGDLATASPTVEQWMNQWLDRIARPRLKPNTLDSYRGSITRYVIPSIGKVRLDKLTPAHVRKMHDYAMAPRATLVPDPEDPEGALVEVLKPRSSTTALQAHRVLAKALVDAEREGRVTRNVATLVDAPAKAVAVRESLDADEARRLLLSVADDATLATHWSVALLAGLRQGERLGLTRGQVDLERGMITVSWQLQRLRWRHGCKPACGRKRGADCPDRYIRMPDGQEGHEVHGGLWLTRPKSRKGWREVPIAAPLHAVLTRYLEGRALEPDDLIFTDEGRPVDPSRDSAAWSASLEAAGLPAVVLHSARHTTATLLHALGADEQTRMQILGHSSATVTAGYTHLSNAITADAMGRLGELLDPRG